MILIFSTNIFELTTAEVIDWLDYKKANYTRVNGADFQGNPVTLSLDESSISLRWEERKLDMDAINVVWLRRIGATILPELASDTEHELANAIHKYAKSEVKAIIHGVFSLLKNKKWLTRPDQFDINKVHALNQAAKAGLHIPDTLVTTDKNEMLRFKRKHQRIIIKTVDKPFMYVAGDASILQYTHEVDETFLNELPPVFFPCCCQAYIEKEYELRVFYFFGKCYAMAIFSQLNTQTAIDFRHYDDDTPNRAVPYSLPESLTKKIKVFMQSVDLQTGSLDLIRTKTGAYVFLEVNPIGQFGMVSMPCNYFLEKEVAKWLIKNDAHEKKQKE